MYKTITIIIIILPHRVDIRIKLCKMPKVIIIISNFKMEICPLRAGHTQQGGRARIETQFS